jgi:NHS family nucleoside permease-like MFS transporter
MKDAGLTQSRVGAAMTLGQVLEILALIALPRVVDRLGRRATMSLGIGSWVLYHGLFASRPGVPLALAAISLNGLAIAFFHVAAPMYLDAEAPADRRAGVQGLWVLLTSGLGGLLGGLLAGEVMHRGGGDWRVVFAVPTAIAAVILVGFATLFRSGIAEEATAPSLHSPRLPTLRPRSARIE